MAIRSVSAPAARKYRSVHIASAVAACSLALILTPTLASAAPRSTAPHSQPAQPSIPDLQKRLGALALKNTQLVEQYNQARIAASGAAKSAKAAAATAATASQRYQQVRATYVQLVQAKYESSAMSGAAELLQSSSDANYMDRVVSMDLVSSHFSQVVTQVATVRASAVQSAATARTLSSQALARRNAVAAQQKTITAQISTYEKMLATLTSQQRAAYQRAQYPSASASTVSSFHAPQATSAAAAKAVSFALKQIGKPYVFGAAGPGSYDCSGLTMASWASAGVSLPHSAADQYNYGTHVSANNLQPGDLLFYYTPIEHVTIYAGDGMMVSAPTEGEDVTLVPVSAYTSDFVGATRLTK